MNRYYFKTNKIFDDCIMKLLEFHGESRVDGQPIYSCIDPLLIEREIKIKKILHKKDDEKLLNFYFDLKTFEKIDIF